MKNNKHKIAVIVVVAAVFGLASGIIGEMVARTSFFGQAWRVPFFGEINFQPTSNLSGPNLIIRDARKVVVEQNIKTEETIKAAADSLAGIFKKKQASKQTTGRATSTFNIDDYYLLDKPLAVGFILTSDGWLMSDFLPPEEKFNRQQSKIGAAATSTASQYVVITKERKVYPVKRIIIDPVSNYSFWQVEARDWPVKKIAADREISPGQMAVAVNWGGQGLVATIAGWQKEKEVIRSSESYNRRLLLSPRPPENFKSSFLFNLNNDLIGFINREGRVLPSGNFSAIIKSLLKNGKIQRPYLGVNYIVLNNLIKPTGNSSAQNNNLSGVLVYAPAGQEAVASGSPAALAGLRTGDIIKAVNNVSLDNDYDLAAALVGFTVGEEIDLTYYRQGQEQVVRVKLGIK